MLLRAKLSSARWGRGARAGVGTCQGIGFYFDSVWFWFLFCWFCRIMFGMVVLCSCSPQRGRCHPGRALGGVADQRKCPGPHFGFGSGKIVDKGGIQDYKVADTSNLAIMMWMMWIPGPGPTPRPWQGRWRHSRQAPRWSSSSRKGSWSSSGRRMFH